MLLTAPSFQPPLAAFGIDWYLNRFARLILADTIWTTNNNQSTLVGAPTDGYNGHDDGNTVNARAQIVF